MTSEEPDFSLLFKVRTSCGNEDSDGKWRLSQYIPRKSAYQKIRRQN